MSFTETRSLWAATLVALLTSILASCSGGYEPDESQDFGAVDFSLVLPDGENISSIDLHLVCPGVDQHHTLEVKQRSVVASFGGLTPGQCHVEMTADEDGGGHCSGGRNFAVIANQTVNVAVTLSCTGENESPSGEVKITTQFTHYDCSQDRIKKIYAIPANVSLGKHTTVQVETYPGSVVGTPTWSFSTRNDAALVAHALLSPAASCDGESCIDVECTSVGSAPGTDPTTGLPAADVAIVVTMKDDHCVDTEEVAVSCIDDTVCGDGVRAGAEQCDDGNTEPGDGCDDQCKLEPCPKPDP